MGKLPNICLIDTNVPIMANMTTDPKNVTSENLNCVGACINAIEHITTNKAKLVIDNGDEIFNEYKKNLDIDWSGKKEKKDG